MSDCLRNVNELSLGRSIEINYDKTREMREKAKKWSYKRLMEEYVGRVDKRRRNECMLWEEEGRMK